MELTKEEFVTTLSIIKDYKEKEEKFIKALEDMCPDNYVNAFVYDRYENTLLGVLEKMFWDENEDISFFLYETGYLFGDSPFNSPFPTDDKGKQLYNSPETLYDYLVAKMEGEL